MDIDDVRRTLDELNRAWRDRRFQDLPRFFDENVVMKGPGLKHLIGGREALVESYAQFMAQAKIVDYAESNHSIACWGDTAAASYDWAMTYEREGQSTRDVGQDMLVFVRRESSWVAVLRVMLF